MAKSATLQVRISEVELAAFRRHVEEQGTTLSSEVLRLIRGVIGSNALDDDFDVAPGGSGGGGEVLAELRVQTELLRQLLTNGAGSSAADAPTPMGVNEDDEDEGSVSRDEDRNEEGMVGSYSGRWRSRGVVLSDGVEG